jgi:NAD(P)-dependent dehydrogenase (short-subunit alcohol dehydrogenase family)/acyl carrier protein
LIRGLNTFIKNNEPAAALIVNGKFDLDPTQQCFVGRRPANRSPRMAFLLPGYHQDLLHLGKILLQEELRTTGAGSERSLFPSPYGTEKVSPEPKSTYLETIRECEQVVHNLTGKSLIDDLLIPEGVTRLGSPTPVCVLYCAIQIALARVCETWIQPNGIIGCGWGQIAAEFLKGSLSLEETLALCLKDPENEHNHQSTVLSGAYDLVLSLGTLTPSSEGHSGATFLPLFQEGLSWQSSILYALALLYSKGLNPNWDNLYPLRGHLVKFPTYPWNRKRYWIPESQPPQDGSTFIAVEKDKTPETLPTPHPDWLYTVEWEQSAIKPEPVLLDGTWLLFRDKTESTEILYQQLKTQPCEIISVFPGDQYSQLGKESYQLNPLDKSQFQVFLETLRPTHPKGILWMWGADENHWHDHTVGFVNLVQSLSALWGTDLPRLWIITHHVHFVTASDRTQTARMHPLASLLWGLVPTLAVEHPACLGGVIDVSSDDSMIQVADLITRETGSGSREKRIAFRKGQRYVARLCRVAKTPAPTEGGHKKFEQSSAPAEGGCSSTDLFRTDCTYLISGGFGDLALLTAEWMLARGARHLLLLSRGKLPERGQWQHIQSTDPEYKLIEAIRRLEACGGSIHHASLDVSSKAELDHLFQTFTAELHPPLAGIIHAAGTVIPEAFLDIHPDSLEAMWTAKVTGSLNLIELLKQTQAYLPPTRGKPFIFFFSSAAAFLGSPFLGGYASANAFLDALALGHHSEECQCLSINWGFWAEAGMAARYQAERGRPLAPRGMTGLPSQEALEVLGFLMNQDHPQVAVFPMDWHEWQQAHPFLAQDPFFEHLTSETGHTPQVSQDSLRELLLRTPLPQHQQVIQTHILSLVASVLDLETGQLSLSQPLTQLGIDSLMAVELRNWIEIQLGIIIPVVEFLKGPTIEDLTQLVLKELSLTPYHGGEVSSPYEVDHLSDQEVEVMLRSLLVEQHPKS